MKKRIFNYFLLVIITLALISPISAYGRLIDPDTDTTDHSLLTNLLWSVSGHTIDTNLDMNSNNIVEIDKAYFDGTSFISSDDNNHIDIHADYIDLHGNLSTIWTIKLNTDGDGFGGDSYGDLVFGSGSDTYLYYNGTDFIIDPDAVGDGIVYIDGNIYADNFIGSGAQLTNLNVTGVMNVSGDFTGYEINVSYLSGANGIGGIDMRGDPWYFSGADFQIVENLIVDNNVTADWGFFKNINATKLFIGNIDVSQVIEDLDGNVYIKNNTSGWNMSFTNDIDFNVNSSLSLNSSEGYIKEMNYTIFDLILNVLTIDESWLTTFWDAIFGTKSTDDLTEGSTNKYDNQSWNESYANNIYYKNGDDANFTSMNTTTININEIEGACDLNKNHSICSNATGTYIIG